MTKVVRWNPMNPVSLMNEFDRLFERPYTRTASNWNIALDVAETEDNYLVKATVPGVNVEDIEITLEDDVLLLKGEIQREEEVEEAKYHLRERRYGRFSRSIRFPMAVNRDAIEATYTNGILSLNVPKAEAVKPKRITINAN
ncbi:Hsp20/alpha crystallin family protein [Candidatus Leptofilum sp.]|uniref:Hsp20/alpha crystallin family protein n=1 Tax=Candidatus Leptofilum sp. TaxID=3241576 RepID=UPI003B5BAB58